MCRRGIRIVSPIFHQSRRRADSKSGVGSRPHMISPAWFGRAYRLPILAPRQTIRVLSLIAWVTGPLPVRCVVLRRKAIGDAKVCFPAARGAEQVAGIVEDHTFGRF